MRHRSLFQFPAILIALCCGSSHASVDVDLTVQNFAGFARDSAAVTTGVPIPLPDTASTWALFVNDTTEIPVQTTLQRGLRTPWLLLNFRATIPAAGSKTYRLASQNPTVTQSPALTITETSAAATIVTGPLKVVVKKSVFNLFHLVYIDKNSDGVFQAGDLLQDSTTIDNLFIVDGNGDTLQGNNAPLAVTWEEQGPLRAILRVDGAYGSPAKLYYSTRMTFYAGRPDVTVEQVYRSSFQSRENNRKIRSAQVCLGGLSSPPTSVSHRIKTPGEKVWLNVADSRARVQLVPDSLVVLTLPSTTTKIGVDANGGMMVPDWSYHGAAMRFDFSQSLGGTEAARRDSSFRDPLMALAPASWYSDRGAFGSESFGTFEDELDTYTKWGLTWGTGDDPDNICNNLFNYPRTTMNASWSNGQLHERNSDELWMNLMMYVRTGNRFFLDKADALARYWKWEFASRTDGFAYASDDPQFDGPAPVFRDSVYLPIGASFTHSDSVYVSTALAAKAAAGHTWNAGIIDYYYFTGDQDALAAGVDLAEKADRHQYWRPDTSATGSNVRFEGRTLLNVLRAYEATGASAWRTSADHIRNRLLYSTSYDSRGFYGRPICELDPALGDICSRFPSPVGTCPDTAMCGTEFGAVMSGIVAQALYRDYVIEGEVDDDVRDRLLELAEFARTRGAHPFSGLTGDFTVADSPHEGSILHLSYNDFLTGVDSPTINTESSVHLIDILTIAYRITNEEKYLSRARQLWDHASRPLGECPVDEGWVPRFQNSMRGYDITQVFPDKGDLTTTQFFFYEAARAGAEDVVAPEAVADLHLETGRTTATVVWTAPGDDEDSGTAEEYDLRISSSTITASNFLSATRIDVGAPSAAGSEQCVELSGLTQCHQYYVALLTRDESGNWSPLSNVDNEQTKCSGNSVALCAFARTPPPSELESADIPHQVEFAIGGANPTTDRTALAYGIPAGYSGQGLRIAVHDVAGRRVRTLVNGLAKPGRFHASWDLTSERGHRVAGGVYFLRFELGRESRAHKIILVR